MMAEEFLESSSGDEVQLSQERIKHFLIGSPRVVTRTIQILHVQGYAEAHFWSKPVAARHLGEPGEVMSVLWHSVIME